MKKITVFICLFAAAALGSVSAQGMLEERVKTGTPAQVQSVINRDVAEVDYRDRDGVSVLMQAAQYSRYPDMVDVLIDAGASVDAVDRRGAAALHYAARYNPDPMMSLRLVLRGADIDVQDHEGWTPLLTAARYNPKRDEVVRSLLGFGAVFDLEDLLERGNTAQMEAALLSGLTDMSYKDLEGATLLMLASAKTSNPAVIDLLVRRGALVHETDPSGWTPLLYAVSANRDPRIIETLIRHGADISVRDAEGWNALLIAARDNPNARVMQTLLDLGAVYHVEQELEIGRIDQLQAALQAGLVKVNQVEASGASLLTLAARSGRDTAVLDLLLRQGADIESRDLLGRSVLSHAAERSSYPGVIDFLLDHGADPTSRDDHFGMTPLMYAAWRNSEVQIVSLLLEGGLNKRDHLGRTALMWSLANPNIEVLQMLIDEGASIHDRTLLGETPLMIASREDSSGSAVRELLLNGARTELKDRRGLTALFYSIDNDSPHAASVLLESGASGEAADASGVTPLYRAVEAGNVQAVQLLLFHGVQVDVSDAEGQTPLMQAAKRGDYPMAKLLLEYSADVLRRDALGRDALILGIINDIPVELAVLLLDAGASVQGFDLYGMTPLMYASRSSSDLRVIELLLDRGASIDQRGGYYDMTSLMFAARYNSPEAVSLLLERGARADILDASKPSMKAVDHGSLNPDVYDTEVFWQMNNLSY